jgi:LmbE family N-acetylglucosaminyl deacetylase
MPSIADAAAETCDSLYVSPAPGDVALSCAGRIVRERAAGQRVLVVTLFAGPGAGGAGAARVAALAALGVEHAALDLPDARARATRETPGNAVLRKRGPRDDDVLHRALDVLTDLAHRTRARQVYAPLAVGGQFDHRLAHEAARAAFTAAEGRNVFLYEERPEVFVPGALRVRLGQLGARLPPAAADAPGPRRLGAYVLRFHLGPQFRGTQKGGWGRARWAWTALREWRSGRSWHPLRALGPRLQPVTYPTGAADLPQVRSLEGEWSSRVRPLARRYAQRLAGSEHAERYWLLLPPRAADGVETLGTGSDDAGRDLSSPPA